MAKLNILFVIFCVATISLAGRIPRDSASVSRPADLNTEKTSIFGDRCEHKAAEGYRLLGEVCPQLAPQQTITESINVIVVSNEYSEFAKAWLKKMNATTSALDQFTLLDELCNFVNNQNYSLDAQSQIVSHDQLCEVAIIRDDIEEENLTETGNVTVTRQVCRIYNSVERIASVSQRESEYPELKTEQLADFETIQKAGNCSSTLACDDAEYFHKVCNFLNETVSHEDQAKKLGIAVQLYEKLVAVKKLYSDKREASRLALAKRSCEVINGIESDGINLSKSGNSLSLPEAKMARFNDLWLEYYQAKDSEKIYTLRDACYFLKDEKIF